MFDVDMTEPSVNYFTCTLGQAANLNCTRPDQRIPEFLEQQSQEHPDLPAVGIYLPPKSSNNNDEWDYRIVTFRQLYNGISAIADTFKVMVSDLEEFNTIALLSPSSAEFLFSWLTLIRLNHPVLLIAPQCTPNAIAQLCQQREVKVLLYNMYEELALSASKEARGLGFHLEPIGMPPRSEAHALDMFEEVAPEPPSYHSRSHEAGEDNNFDVAYLHHTSGTSTGIPKPIPQTHRGGLGVLPRLDGSAAATFTTTPLYHGGVADAFRAWTSNALIWLFPGKDRPITAANVVKCLDIATQVSQNSSSKRPIPPVKYFSSVPYVLQMLAEDQSGLGHLQNLDLVGVGGAALPTEVGNDLVSNGVNLVSRFGSAECGFLISSHRDYKQDEAWQYLRPGEGGQRLRFEPREEGLSELVVQNGWPHMAKTNREDGSFATSDLFQAHPEITNAWKYHSRADSQLTLVTGKKFDPAPLETALVASSPAIADVLIFGNERPYPGALVFRSREAERMTEGEVKKELERTLAKLNEESQSHARIGMDMVFVMPYEEQGLDKSSKGTTLRGKAEDRYKDAIDRTYIGAVPDSEGDVPDADLASAVLNIVNTIMSSKKAISEPLSPETDLFAAGIDSIASVQIRRSLARLLPKDAPALPLSVVQDAGTVHNLSQILLQLRQGKTVTPSKDLHTVMREMVEKHSNYSHIPPSTITDHSQRPWGTTILLTGATGSLGAHILSLLLSHPRISHIYLLVRGATLQAATERVRKALTLRQLPIPGNFDSRITILPCRLQDPNLGLDEAHLEWLRKEITCIMHLAWDVNFLLNLPQFEKTHITGLRNLISLAATSTHPTGPPRFLFCSSTASVSSHLIPIPESLITDPSCASNTGYSQSKWVAENVLAAGASQHPNLASRVTIMRVGQLSGNSQTGVWNASEAYPLMLSSAKKDVVGCLPDLDKARRAQGERGEELNWLPVDSAAQAFVEAALSEPLGRRHAARTQSQDLIDFADKAEEGVEVLHVLPPPRDTVKNWTSVLVAMKMAEGVNIAPVAEWLSKLEKLRDEKGIDAHPSLKLIDFWRNAYIPDEGDENDSDTMSLRTMTTHISALDMYGDEGEEVGVSGGFEMRESLARMPSLRGAREVDMGYVLKVWKWIKANV